MMLVGVASAAEPGYADSFARCRHYTDAPEPFAVGR
jgi:hypothetical protein